MRFWMCVWVCAVSAVASGRAAEPLASGASGEVRALWVTRWDYRSPADVRRVLDECASLGVTDVMWQVRGQFDAMYRSEIEPWARDLFTDDPSKRDPGFDPLEQAVAVAHARGLRLHAWVNVYPMWKGKTPPSDPRHALNASPAWRLHDRAGKPQPFNDHYVVANPTDPAVKDRIVAVCRDIVSRYEVNGLHLDYVRFVSDTLEKEALYPGDAATLGRFTAARPGGDVESAPGREAFRAWIRDEITALVRRLRDEAVSARPGVVLTAAVWRRPDLGRDTYLQDGAAWLRDGLLDRAFPMIYTADNARYESDLNSWLDAAPGRPITPGIGIYTHDKRETVGEQVARGAAADGWAIFGYSSMFESVDPQQDHAPAAVAARAMRREAVAALLASERRPGPAPSPGAR